VKIGPGAPPRYCSAQCRRTARANRRSIAYVARAEIRRIRATQESDKDDGPTAMAA